MESYGNSSLPASTNFAHTFPYTFTSTVQRLKKYWLGEKEEFVNKSAVSSRYGKEAILLRSSNIDDCCTEPGPLAPQGNSSHSFLQEQELEGERET